VNASYGHRTIFIRDGWVEKDELTGRPFVAATL
jgi:hypothetical protein